MIFKFIYVFINPMEDKSQEIFRFFAPLRMTGREPEFRLWYQMPIGSLLLHLFVNPVRNSSEALNPAEIFIKSNPAAEQWGIISNGVNRPSKYSPKRIKNASA
jgi:hypothetical protein